jgi:hypothetical protein
LTNEPDKTNPLTFQWRLEANSQDAYCYHVKWSGNGWTIINPERNQPIASAKAFEPMPGQIKFWGKVYEWNAMAATFTVHNYEFASARGLRSWLNKRIRDIVGNDCQIIGGKRGRPAGATVKAVRNARDRKRRRDRLRAERFAHIEAMVARAGETIPSGLTHAQVIDWILDKGLDER